MGDVRPSRYVETTGAWHVRAPDCEPANLDSQIQAIFASLSSDMALWSDLAARFSMDVFCGLFMSTGNEGVGLSAETLEAMGSRGVELSLDIYDADDDRRGELGIANERMDAFYSVEALIERTLAAETDHERALQLIRTAVAASYGEATKALDELRDRTITRPDPTP